LIYRIWHRYLAVPGSV